MSSLNPRSIFGGFEEDYEREKPILSSITQGFSELISDALSIGEDLTDGGSSESESNKLTIGGQQEIDFNNRESEAEKKLKQKIETDKKKAFYAALEQDRIRTQQAKEKMLYEEEINDITANMPTEEKNRLLHYQSSYKDRSVYQIAALRKKIIEDRKKGEKQKTEASIAQTKPQASAMNAAFEGGSGTQGGGTANLSAHATG